MALTAGIVDGALTSAIQIRRVINFATRGETSIMRGTDLKVVPTSVPSSSVIVMPGTVAISAEASYGGPQSYIVTNDSATSVAVPANTASSARTLYVIAAVRDPQYAGMPMPANRDTDPYVDLLVQSVVPSDRPCAVLAKIAQPGSTSTITAAMIDDKVRPFEFARTDPDLAIRNPITLQNMSKSSYGSFPLSDFSVIPPRWASEVVVIITATGINYSGTDEGRAGLRVVFDNATSENTIITASGRERITGMAAAKFPISAAQRGVPRYIGLQALQSGGAGNFSIDYQSQIAYSWTFKETLR